MSEYYAPKNFNFWYFFGVLSLVVLVMQLLTGIWLTMNYTPSAEAAFASVEYIMRDVEWGWLLRYLHSTGASAFFVVVYVHMFRGLMYGSYQKPENSSGFSAWLSISFDDGRLHGLCSALGPAVLLGGECNRISSRCHSRNR